MHKKPTGKTATRTRAAAPATSEAVRNALARPTTRLEADEEKVLRMLNGVSAPRTLVLERVGQDHPDSRQKLLGLELELLRQWRERQAQTGRPDPRSQKAAPAKAEPAANPRRDRIVQALKNKPTK